MGYKELVQDLIQTAEADRDRVMSRAREEARDIVRRAMEEAENIQLRNQEDLKKDVSKEMARRERKRDKDLRMVSLRDKKELVEAVLKGVEEKLRTFSRNRGYPGLVRDLLGELKEEIGGRPFVLRADPYAKKALRSEIQSKGIRIEKLPGEEWGGLEAVLDDGKVYLRNTLKSRYLKNQENLFLELGRWIEGND